MTLCIPCVCHAFTLSCCHFSTPHCTSLWTGGITKPSFNQMSWSIYEQQLKWGCFLPHFPFTVDKDQQRKSDCSLYNCIEEGRAERSHTVFDSEHIPLRGVMQSALWPFIFFVKFQIHYPVSALDVLLHVSHFLSIKYTTLFKHEYVFMFVRHFYSIGFLVIAYIAALTTCIVYFVQKAKHRCHTFKK